MKLLTAGVGLAALTLTSTGANTAETAYRFTAVKVMVPDCEKRQLIPKQWIKDGLDQEELASRRPTRDEFAPEAISDRLYRSLCTTKKNGARNS